MWQGSGIDPLFRIKADSVRKLKAGGEKNNFFLFLFTTVQLTQQIQKIRFGKKTLKLLFYQVC